MKLNLKKIKFNEWVGIASICLVAVLGIASFSYLNYVKQNNNVAVSETKPQKIENPFEDLDLEAKSVFVWDVKNQKPIFSKDSNRILPLASLTKIMTALVAKEKLSPNLTITIDPLSLMKDGDNGLLIGERWQLEELLDFSLLVSSNDGISAIAGAIGSGVYPEQSREKFIEEMNKRAEDLKLETLTFYNESGLDLDKIKSGAYGSARDIARLLEYTILFNPDLLEVTRYDSQDFVSYNNFLHKATNTNEIVNEIPNLIASKTGYTDLSGGNLVVAFNAGLNHPVIISLLGSSFEGRFVDMEKLIDATREKIEQDYVLE